MAHRASCIHSLNGLEGILKTRAPVNISAIITARAESVLCVLGPIF
ncbi:MAG TPA: hypothetical protein VKL40_12295 [Candidatus Angelobacter sp.]|nr:hypothetical protein [Candidatus Angelobacter sp.]